MLQVGKGPFILYHIFVAFFPNSSFLKKYQEKLCYKRYLSSRQQE